MRLSGKVALVTGGASGIGRSTALTFAREGATVVVADLNLAGAEETVQRLDGKGSAEQLNVADEAAWIAAFDRVLVKYGRLDILVNCAGIGWAGNFEDMPIDAWNAMVAVNLTGVMIGCKHGVRAMRQAGNGGSIVNISSVGGLVGGDDIAGYCATKGGVTLLTKSVALHCARYQTGIRCNSIHPTYVDTEMLDPVAAAFPNRQVLLDGMASGIPMGRVAVPQDIADAILFLASEEASLVSGHSMVVDGAQLAGIPSRHTV